MNKNTEFVNEIALNKCDPALGQKVHARLKELGVEHPFTDDPDYMHAHNSLEDGIQALYLGMGLNLSDPSIKATPSRVADMFVGELFRGLNYDFFPKCTATPNGKAIRYEDTQFGENVGKLQGGYNEMVLTGGLRTISVCEHHLQTIDGHTWVGYIPGPKVLGLSKFARVVDFFARRPQIQERMTEQIYAALSLILETPDVAVVQRCKHYCMIARGVNQTETYTETSKMGGRFMENPSLRVEFTNAIAR